MSFRRLLSGANAGIVGWLGLFDLPIWLGSGGAGWGGSAVCVERVLPKALAQWARVLYSLGKYGDTAFQSRLGPAELV